MEVTPNPPEIKIRIETDGTKKIMFCFTDSFLIGRGKGCDLRIEDDIVSRSHAEIRFEEGNWRVYDLKSANGIFVDGEKVAQAPLANHSGIRLGKTGPLLTVMIGETSQTEKTHSLDHYTDHYFGNSDDDTVGEHTMMVRRAFEVIQKKQKKKYAGIITLFVLLFFAAGTYGLFKHIQVNKQKALAENIFYAMKSMELEFAGVLKAARLSKDAESKALVESYVAKRKEMEENYDQFIETLDVYGNCANEEERLILQVARTFGECEVNMPDGFAEEVMKYIEKWKETERMPNAITRANRKGYVQKIVETMKSQGLPPQFLYLALQESNLNTGACGPKTRYGIAKGMWQFIPSTAADYGLRVGPLAKERVRDPEDERHDFERSTLAAARYIRYIYDTEAQASGLLVMASYNWGEHRVIELIRTLPENPKERNFWCVLENHKKKIPKQTYDFVFYIVSATVIGQNPRLFGFDFDNPIASVTNQKFM
ncbi:MAG: FHA domain-containing protein [bacterium]|nr:FHA domain-containing protein [bacterium]